MATENGGVEGALVEVGFSDIGSDRNQDVVYARGSLPSPLLSEIILDIVKYRNII